MAMLAVVSTAPSRALGQRVESAAIEDDNGQFDFWLPAWKRPDTELANSMQARVSLEAVPVWGAWFHVGACGSSMPTARCGTTALSLGQEMYTPSAAITSAQPQPGQRPYAGWLYAATTARVASSRSSDAVTLELGVTGRPSLAEQVQTAWHALIGYPRALGWAHQIPFQPGVLLTAEHDAEVARVTIGDVPVLSVVPRASVTAGNVATGASGGLQMRAGFGVTPFWSHATPGRARPLEIYALGDIQEDLVVHRLVLDAPASSSAVRIAKLPLVNQYAFGAGARFGAMEVEYRGIMRAREYVTGPPHEPYGVLTLGVRPGW